MFSDKKQEYDDLEWVRKNVVHLKPVFSTMSNMNMTKPHEITGLNPAYYKTSSPDAFRARINVKERQKTQHEQKHTYY